MTTKEPHETLSWMKRQKNTKQKNFRFMQKSNRANRKKLLLVLILFSLIISVILNIKALNIHSTTPKSNISPSAITAGWRTHKNSDYGFTFRYPPSFLLRVEKNIENDVYYTYRFKTIKELTGSEYFSGFQVSIFPTNGKTIEQRFEDQGEGFQNIEKITYLPTSGKIDEAADLTKRGGNISRVYRLGDKFCWITKGINTNAPDKNGEIPFEYILSTFKFPESTSKEAMKSYTDEELDFSFLYPSTWKLKYEPYELEDKLNWYVKIQSPDFVAREGMGYLSSGTEIMVIVSKTQEKSIDEWYAHFNPAGNPYNKSTIIVAGEKAYQADNAYEGPERRATNFIKNGIFFTIVLTNSDDQTKQQNLPIYEGVLSSFNFTEAEPVPTPGWNVFEGKTLYNAEPR